MIFCLKKNFDLFDKINKHYKQIILFEQKLSYLINYYPQKKKLFLLNKEKINILAAYKRLESPDYQIRNMNNFYI